MIAPMKLVSGWTSVRGTMSRSASRRALPTRTSASARRNSSDERALELLDDLAQRGVEAEAGADGDRQQVEGVRDHQQDGLLALLDPAAEPELRDDVADDQRRPAPSRCRCTTGKPSRPTTPNRRKKRSRRRSAPMALMPSQSATRRSPGLPASARRFSVRSANEVAGDPRDGARTGGPRAGGASARRTAAGARAPRGSWPASTRAGSGGPGPGRPASRRRGRGR